MNNLGKLFVVATPIGNLEDITFRAIRTLKEVDFILCEDTRTTKILLDKYEIKTKTISYNAHATNNKESLIFKLIKERKNLAMVSDAGTPCISDPGVLLIKNLREEFENQIEIIPIPGPSALITALSVSGISAASFMFIGFLPHKKGRETLFKEIAISKIPVIFYESTHRILKTLSSLNDFCPNKNIFIGREMTKHFEEFKKGQASFLLNYLNENKEKQKGEFVVIVDSE